MARPNVEVKIKKISASILTKEQIVEACNECASKIASNARRVFGGTGEYAIGWTWKITDPSLNDMEGTVFNETQPSLAHLLEFGHRTTYKTGKYGDKQVWIPPQKHITPAYDDVRDKFYRSLQGVEIKWESKNQ